MLRYKSNSIFMLVAILLLIIYAQASFAAQSVPLPVRLAWDRNGESDLAYYRVYYGTSSRNYSNYIIVDKQYPSYTLNESILTVGQTYYIALTALDYSLNESGCSGEITLFITPSTNTTTTMTSSTIVIEAEDMSYYTHGAGWRLLVSLGKWNYE